MSPTQDPQRIYARWLEVSAQGVTAFSVISLGLYFSGLVAPAVALQDLPGLWTLSAAEFQRRAGVSAGWSWLGLVGRADYMNLLAISLFALLGLVCTLRVIPAFLRSGERTQALLSLAQAVVLTLAAAELLGT